MPQFASDVDALAVARFRGPVMLDEAAGVVETPPAGQMTMYQADGRIRSVDSAGVHSEYATTADVLDPPLTKSWSIFGHSYMHMTLTQYQTSRTDALLREALGAEHTAWRNRAVTGARIVQETRRHGGWTRIFQECANAPGRASGPYTPVGGGMLLCYGINDVTGYDQSETARQAFKGVLRAAISRWRAATVYEDNHGVGSRVTYGSGWGEDTFYSDVGSGNTSHYTTTAGSSFTLTLPSDYRGEPVVLQFIGKASDDGGIASISGTAGIVDTVDTNLFMPDLSFTRCPLVKRYTGLTSANAGQTIVVTVTSLGGGAGGDFTFDSWWLESLTPPPVIVCNIPRLTADGYALYPSWGGTEPEKDAVITSWNAAVAELPAEFDGMVQVADLDGALNKDASLFIEGLHPNDAGGAKVVDAILDAMRLLTAPAGLSQAASFAPAAPRSGPLLRPRRAGHWYTADGRGAGSNYTAVAGDLFAIPFHVTQAASRFGRIAVEAIASVTGTAVRWGIYDDVDGSGYPQVLIVEPTDGGAFSITTGAGSKQNPAVGTGSLTWVPDPGLYWLAVKFTTVGVSHTFRALAGPSLFLPNVSTAGVGNIQPSGWKLTGKGTGVLDTIFPSGAALSDNCPMIALQHT